MPVIGGTAKFQPVFVGDVARAVAAAVAHPDRHPGKTYELGGPETFSMARLNGWIADATGRKRFFIDVPDVAAGDGACTGWLPGAPMTWDQWLMLQNDNVVVAGEPGLAELGVTSTPLEAVAPGWLALYTRTAALVPRQARRERCDLGRHSRHCRGDH